eukprot:767074-Amphidinium_carterae.1
MSRKPLYCGLLGLNYQNKYVDLLFQVKFGNNKGYGYPLCNTRANAVRLLGKSLQREPFLKFVSNTY